MISWFAGLSFAAPLALAALAALPAIYLLLRVTPPAPRRIVFPPLKLFAHIRGRRETPARTPWWLMALRLLLAACVILAAAGPVWNARPGDDHGASGAAPLALVIDSGAASAHDWALRMDLAARLVEAAGRGGAPVALFATGEPATPQAPEAAPAMLRHLGALAPQAFFPDRRALLPVITAFVRAHAQARIVWISDGVSVTANGAGSAGEEATPSDAASARDFARSLGELAGDRLLIYDAGPSGVLALAGVVNGPEGLEAHVVRPSRSGSDETAAAVTGMARASDARGLPLGEAGFSLAPGAAGAVARIALPIEIRNRVARVDLVGQHSAQAVALLDRRHQRRRVGLVAGVAADQAQPLLSPTWYVDRALAPTAEIREPRMGASEAVAALIDEKASVIVLADVGTLDPETRKRLGVWVQAGGVLVRFAGQKLAASGPTEPGFGGADDDLLPVRLRGDGRNLGGALSWETPRNLAAFTRGSPFAGIATPEGISVRRQLLAEPDGELPGRTWAALADGTPVVTARRDGAGLLVLFHVTGDPSWSNLPMSGAFVEMLQRLVAMAPNIDAIAEPKGGSGKSGDDAGPGARAASDAPHAAARLAPRRMLDGFGAWRDPPATARGIAPDYTGRASLPHPAGIYGTSGDARVVNVLDLQGRLVAADFRGFDVRALTAPTARDLRGPLLLLAALLFLADSLAMLLLGGGLGLRGAASAGKTFASKALLAALLGGGVYFSAGQQQASAQGMLNAPPYRAPESMQAPPGWRTPQGLPTPGFAPRPQGAPAYGPGSRPVSPPRAAAGGLSGKDLDAAAETRLAYVVTGDRDVDAISRAGLEGLGQTLALRTSFEPAAPVGVNPSSDELAFYPVLYWPVVAGRPLPDAVALRKLDSYMKGGGLVIFDTRDALRARPGVTTPEGAQLQQMLRTLDLPPLELAPSDHVLGKSFYLLDNFPGRYSSGQTWVEALPLRPDGSRAPARGGDGVTPLIITSNDWAAAWAVDASGLPLLPLATMGNDSEDRQRELALRVGVNTVIHALTGNYKADQVHLPAILRRFGQ